MSKLILTPEEYEEERKAMRFEQWEGSFEEYAALTSQPGMVTCGTCLTPLYFVDIVINDCLCPLCGNGICFICGCTEQAACDPPCAWARPGVCTTHEVELLAECERIFGGA
jgi:hypothetical protein